MSNKNGPDTGDIPALMREADDALEKVYYAISRPDLALRVGQIRVYLAKVYADLTKEGGE